MMMVNCENKIKGTLNLFIYHFHILNIFSHKRILLESEKYFRKYIKPWSDKKFWQYIFVYS